MDRAAPSTVRTKEIHTSLAWLQSLVALGCPTCDPEPCASPLLCQCEALMEVTRAGDMRLSHFPGGQQGWGPGRRGLQTGPCGPGDHAGPGL